MKALELLGKLRKKSNDKGFTLVELIVVLVILAILAAILVPALLGYIDRARNSQTLLNAKSALTAAQAEMSSLYGANKDADEVTNRASQIITTADVDSDCTALDIACADMTNVTATSTHHNAFTINYVKYTNAKGTVYFINNEWITEGTPTGIPTTVYTIR